MPGARGGHVIEPGGYGYQKIGKGNIFTLKKKINNDNYGSQSA